MEESSEKKEYIFDTSALISLGAIKLVDEVLALARIALTASIVKELEEFAKYDDEYGKASKEVLKYHRNPITLDYHPEFDNHRGLIGFLGCQKTKLLFANALRHIL